MELGSKKRFKLIPPDGGYAYCILAAASVNIVAETMFIASFGLIFKEFLITHGMGTTSINLLTGIRAIAMTISGFVIGPLLKMMSLRKVSFVGAALYNVGAIGTVFVNSELQFFICFGFLQTMGMGVVFNVSITALHDYFLEKRMLSVALANVLGAASTILAPILVSWATVEYGYRGTLLVISCIGMQAFVASAAMQPVTRHLKKVELTEKEVQLLPAGEKMPSPGCDVMLKDDEAPNSLTEDQHRNISCINFATKLINSVDWRLMKRLAPTTTCLGLSLGYFLDMTFLSNLAQAFIALKYNEEELKWCFIAIAFGDLAGRIILVLFSTWLKVVSNRLLYYISLLMATTMRLAMLWVTDHHTMLACLAMAGVARGFFCVLMPLVLADFVLPEQFPSALGLVWLLMGVISITLGPIIGAIRDATDNFAILFGIVIALYVAISVAWTAAMLRDWRRGRVNNSEL